MKTDVRNEPHYEELVGQIRSRRCVAFIGSGLSINHYPSWPTLISRLCVECGLPDPKLDESADAGLLIQLADDAYDNNPEAYYRVLDEEFGRPVIGTRPAYDLLMRLPFLVGGSRSSPGWMNSGQLKMWLGFSQRVKSCAIFTLLPGALI